MHINSFMGVNIFGRNLKTPNYNDIPNTCHFKIFILKALWLTLIYSVGNNDKNIPMIIIFFNVK